MVSHSLNRIIYCLCCKYYKEYTPVALNFSLSYPHTGHVRSLKVPPSYCQSRETTKKGNFKKGFTVIENNTYQRNEFRWDMKSRSILVPFHLYLLFFDHASAFNNFHSLVTRVI